MPAEAPVTRITWSMGPPSPSGLPSYCVLVPRIESDRIEPDRWAQAEGTAAGPGGPLEPPVGHGPLGPPGASGRRPGRIAGGRGTGHTDVGGCPARTVAPMAAASSDTMASPR